MQQSQSESWTLAWINASAAAERGLKVHLNGSGYLAEILANTWGRYVRSRLATHVTSPVVYSPLGSITLPFSSSGLDRVYVDRTEAMAIHIDDSARYLPGHILRPNPNAACSVSFMFGSKLPEDVRKRSGMNLSGSGNVFSSWSIALRGSGSMMRSTIAFRQTHHELPTTMLPAGIW